MADVYQNIYEIVKIRSTTFSEIASSLGISRQSLSRVFTEKTLTVKRLEDICEILKIEPSILWSENIKIHELNEELIKYSTTSTNNVSNKTIKIEEVSNNIANRLLDQIQFLNKVINDQIEIIKNLS